MARRYGWPPVGGVTQDPAPNTITLTKAPSGTALLARVVLMDDHNRIMHDQSFTPVHMEVGDSFQFNYIRP